MIAARAQALHLRPADREESSLLMAALAAGIAHALLALFLAILPATRDLPDQPEALPVDILSSAEFESIRRPTPPLAPATPMTPDGKIDGSLAARRPETPAAPIPRATPAPGMIRADIMLSGAILADPRSRKTVALLRRLDRDGKVEQLCGLEAMAQIGRHDPALHADKVVAYAMADLKRAGDMLIADGAAFWSKGAWYNLAFRCRISADREKIVAFEFLPGDAIPRGRWAAHNLPIPERSGDDPD